MRLLYLNHNYRHNGTYYRAMPMAEQLAARGHAVTVLCVSRTRRWRAEWSTANGVRIGEMPNLALGNSAEGYGPLDLLLRNAHSLAHYYDLIHLFDHKPNATFAGFLGGRLRGARLVADWADWWTGPGSRNDTGPARFPLIRRFEAWWEPRSKLWAEGVVTISRVLENRARDLGCRRVLYLPTGAALDRIQPLARAEARQRLGVPLDQRLIGFIGAGQGDLEIVLAAMQSLGDVRLMIIGAALPAVRALAQQFGVAERIWQTGFIADNEVSVYLACADVMCLPMTDTPANRGRLPNKLLDYMAAGRPIVASPVGDVKVIFETHAVGKLASDEAFADALRSLLDDPAGCARLGEAARRTAELHFNWPTLIDQLEAFYQTLP
ncbi:MAG: glycosyltransferase family 4 protein [Anaerolineales bacterium]